MSTPTLEEQVDVLSKLICEHSGCTALSDTNLKIVTKALLTAEKRGYDRGCTEHAEDEAGADI